MLSGFWIYAASTPAAVLVGFLALTLIVKAALRDPKSSSTRLQRAAAAFALCASVYTFGVLTISQLVISGPSVSDLIEHGFGNERVAWLMLVIICEQGIRIIDLMRAK